MNRLVDGTKEHVRSLQERIKLPSCLANTYNNPAVNHFFVQFRVTTSCCFNWSCLGNTMAASNQKQRGNNNLNSFCFQRLFFKLLGGWSKMSCPSARPLIKSWRSNILKLLEGMHVTRCLFGSAHSQNTPASA